MKHHEPKPTAHEREPTLTPKPLAVTLDLETYRAQLEDWDASDDQKTEFIKTMWELLLSFAQIGFEIHPAQIAQKTGRKKPSKPAENKEKSKENATALAPDLLYSNPYIRTQINISGARNAAVNEPDSDMEGANP